MESWRKQRALEVALGCLALGCADSLCAHPVGILVCSGSQRQNFHNIVGRCCCTVECSAFAVASWLAHCGRRDFDQVAHKLDSELALEFLPDAVGIDSWLVRSVALDLRPSHTDFSFELYAFEDSDRATFALVHNRWPFLASSPLGSYDLCYFVGSRSDAHPFPYSPFVPSGLFGFVGVSDYYIP